MGSIQNIFDDSFLESLYNIVSRDFELPDYSQKKNENLYIILSNYYNLSRLILDLDKKNYFYDKNFRFFFVKAVFEGNFDCIYKNFEYLIDLKKRTNGTINIIDDVKLLYNLFSYRDFSLTHVSLDTLEVEHSLIVDSVPSEDVYEAYGSIDDFSSIINDIAHNSDIPRLFYTLLPTHYDIGYNISNYCFDKLILNRIPSIINNLSICEMCQIPLVDGAFPFYSFKLSEDIAFFKERYAPLNNIGIFYTDLKHKIEKLRSYKSIFGSFKEIFNRLDSISKNLFSSNFNIFDYFMKDENLSLFDEIVMSLDSYIDFSGFLSYKIADFCDLSNIIADELGSKLYLYYYLDKNSNSLFRIGRGGSIYTLNTMKAIAQIKKDEIDGKISYDDAILKVKEIFSDYYINDYGSLCYKGDASLMSFPDINSNNFAVYFLLCENYFKSLKDLNCSFEDIYDFILKNLRKSNNRFCESFIDLLKINPQIINYFNIEDSGINDEIGDSFYRFEEMKEYGFYGSIETCLSFKLEDFDFSSDSMSEKDIIKLFDIMALRYHSRINLDDFYKNNYYTLPNSDGSYAMKDLYKNKVFNWKRDRIHTLIYFAYLENNMAHDVSDYTIYNYLRVVDHYSNLFAKNFTFKFNELKKVTDRLLSDIKDNCLIPNNLLYGSKLSSVIKKVRTILCDSSVTDKRSALIQYLGNVKNGDFNSSFIDSFLDKFVSDSEFYSLYFDLAIECVNDFDYKEEFIKNIIIKFYEDLKKMRTENNDNSDSLRVTKEEASQFYEKYGYLIDIRYDSNSNCAVLYMLDKYLEFTHSVHMLHLPNVIIPSMNNAILEFYDTYNETKMSKGIDSNFEFHIKTSANARVPMKVLDANNSYSVSPNVIKACRELTEQGWFSDSCFGEKYFFDMDDLESAIQILKHSFDSLNYTYLSGVVRSAIKLKNEQRLSSYALSAKKGVHI
ncbi:MAG: hypothetical protein ACI4XM_07285 [Candidatus Coprovivens sp.]